MREQFNCSLTNHEIIKYEKLILTLNECKCYSSLVCWFFLISMSNRSIIKMLMVRIMPTIIFTVIVLAVLYFIVLTGNKYKCFKFCVVQMTIILNMDTFFPTFWKEMFDSSHKKS